MLNILLILYLSEPVVPLAKNNGWVEKSKQSKVLYKAPFMNETKFWFLMSIGFLLLVDVFTSFVQAVALKNSKKETIKRREILARVRKKIVFIA